MTHPNNQHDLNDVTHIESLGKTVVEVEPCPIKDGKINPHVTRVTTSDGQVHDVFHIKPIYFEHKDGGFRPLSEIADEFGNSYCKLKADWKTKISPRFLDWYAKRMDIVNKDKTDDLVLELDEQKKPKKVVPRGLSELKGNKYERLTKEEIKNHIGWQ